MTNFNAIDEITEIDDLRDLARDMQAEIARLREALAAIVDDSVSLDGAMRLSRAALEQKP